MKCKDGIEKHESNHQKIEILKETIRQGEVAEYVVMRLERIGRIALTKIIKNHQAQKK